MYEELKIFQLFGLIVIYCPRGHSSEMCSSERSKISKACPDSSPRQGLLMHLKAPKGRM